LWLKNSCCCCCFFDHANIKREEEKKRKKNYPNKNKTSINRLSCLMSISKLCFFFILQMADNIGRRKENIVDLNKYLDKRIRVKFNGGRECSGVLKGNNIDKLFHYHMWFFFINLGYDQLLNLVLDQTIEYLRDPDDEYKISEDTRQLGLVVCRGTSVVLICPLDGMEEIPNPFVQHE
jgi:U6 snRNA-associated Sm-like protein LSm7